MLSSSVVSKLMKQLPRVAGKYTRVFVTPYGSETTSPYV
jgi:hypothetical protein